MRVRVRLFAGLRDIVGRAELERDVPVQASIGDLWNALVLAYPALARYATSVSCAQNEEYARMSARLNDGDEIAFLPPVSGGAPALAVNDHV